MTISVAYIDEYGDASFQFDKPDTSSHFIVVCVLLEEKNRVEANLRLEQIRKQYFQTGEIKSKLVGNDDVRRIRILNEITRLDFRLIPLIVDKRKLEGEGFNYKPSFYKFLNSLLYDELYKIFSDLDIYMDEIGHEKFMSGFIRYIRGRNEPDLFTEQRDIFFQNSKSNLFIQLADFIAGTLARVYDEKKYSPSADKFIHILRKHIGDIIFFPKTYDRYQYHYDSAEMTIDNRIADLALKSAYDFIELNQDNNDPAVALQVRTARLLRLYRQTIHFSKYIPTREILEHLNYDSKEKISVHFFRTNVIAKLRDNRVLIASSSMGYKLPTSKADLYDFLNHGTTVIIPMLSRIERCVQAISIRTGENILDKEEYLGLSKLLKQNHDQHFRSSKIHP